MTLTNLSVTPVPSLFQSDMTVSNPGPASQQCVALNIESSSLPAHPSRRPSDDDTTSLDGSANDMVPPIYINDAKAQSRDFRKPQNHLTLANDAKLFAPPTDFVSVSPLTLNDSRTHQFQLDSLYREQSYQNTSTLPLLGPNPNENNSLPIMPPQEKLTRAGSIRVEAKKAQNRQQLELSRAKLKATSRTSALLAGFAMVQVFPLLFIILKCFEMIEVIKMCACIASVLSFRLFYVAIVELDLSQVKPNYGPLMSNGSSVPDDAGPSDHNLGMIIFFGVCTTLLVSVHLLALMMSTCILPHLDSAYLTNDGSSPHLKLQWYIEASWLFSTCFGLMLFLLEIGIVFWIKFMPLGYTPAAYVTTALLVPVFIIFICFTMTFYKTLMRHKVDKFKGKLDELQKMYGLEAKTLQGVTVI